MIENFNFYDFYGYLIPGFVLLSILAGILFVCGVAIPHFSVKGLLLIIILGYVSGKILQSTATCAFPSKVKNDDGDLKYPSDLFLDRREDRLNDEVKKTIYEVMEENHNIDLSNPEEDEDVGKLRQTAFKICRSTLVKRGFSDFPQQFQGLYALMRGMFVSSLLGITFVVGLILGGYLIEPSFNVKLILISLALIFPFIFDTIPFAGSILRGGVDARSVLVYFFGIIMVYFLVGGAFFSYTNEINALKHLPSLMFFLTGLLFLLFVSWIKYKKHAENFADRIYTDFYILYD